MQVRRARFLHGNGEVNIMSRLSLSCLAAGCMMSVFVACGDDNDDDDDQPSQATTTSSTTTRTTSTSAGTGTTGSGGTRTTSGGTTTRGTTAGTATGSGGAAGDGGMGGEGGMAGAAVLMDEEILHAARTANMGEVEQAEIALMRADDADVLDFAEMMVDEHSDAVTSANDLAEAEDLDPAPNPVSQMLRSDSERIIMMLEDADDAEFDLVYMNAQVMAHQEVLMLLDDTLIPQTTTRHSRVTSGICRCR